MPQALRRGEAALGQTAAEGRRPTAVSGHESRWSRFTVVQQSRDGFAKQGTKFLAPSTTYRIRSGTPAGSVTHKRATSVMVRWWPRA